MNWTVVRAQENSHGLLTPGRGEVRTVRLPGYMMLETKARWPVLGGETYLYDGDGRTSVLAISSGGQLG